MTNICVEQIDILNLPSVLLSEKRLLPETPCIYFVISNQGSVLYVGRATNLKSRWLDHHKIKSLLEYADIRIAWMEVQDIKSLPDIESKALKHFSPRLNLSSHAGGLKGTASNANDRIMIRIDPKLKSLFFDLANSQSKKPSSILKFAIESYIAINDKNYSPGQIQSVSERVSALEELLAVGISNIKDPLMRSMMARLSVVEQLSSLKKRIEALESENKSLKQLQAEAKILLNKHAIAPPLQPNVHNL